MQKTLLEALAILVAGFLLAALANTLSPMGLKISRNYFPSGAVTSRTNTPSSPGAMAPGPTNTAGTNLAPQAASTNTSAAIERLQSKGLQHLLTPEAAALYRDPAYQSGTIIFLDARDDADYEAGHIPGAYQLFHYRPEKYLPVVLPISQVAQKIIVYCNGGDCEDSEFAAIMLRDAGVPPDKLRVYLGGFTEWQTNNLPVEIGPRMSGNITNAN